MQTTKLNNAILKTFKTGDDDDAAIADVVKLRSEEHTSELSHEWISRMPSSA